MVSIVEPSALSHISSSMELRDFISFLQKNVIWIVTCAFVGVFAGVVVASLALLHPGWKAEVRLTRELADVPPAFVLDGYYTIETTRAFGMRLGRLLLDESFRDKAASQGATFGRAERFNEREWTIRINAKEYTVAVQSTRQLEALLNAKLSGFSQESHEAFLFGAAVSEPQPTAPLFSPEVALLVGGALGVIFAALGVITIRYFRQQSS